MASGGLLISPARISLRFPVQCALESSHGKWEAEPVSHELRAPLPQCVKSQVLPDCPAQELHKLPESPQHAGNPGRRALDGQGAATVNQ